MRRLRSIRQLWPILWDSFFKDIKFLPFIEDVKVYDLPKFKSDAHAAANVTFLALAQAIAFAAIAGLPVVYGLVCTAVASITAPLFAGSRYTIIGPTNATAFMLFSFFVSEPELKARYHELIPILVFFIGILTTLGGLFCVADLLQYISRSVLVGYITGAGILIIANQTEKWLNLTEWIHDHSTFVGMLKGILTSLHHVDLVSCGIGVATVSWYLLIKKLRPKWPAFALSLVLSSAIFGVMIQQKHPWFIGRPTFAPFTIEQLLPEWPNFFQPSFFSDLSKLFGIALAISFLAVLENTLMAKTLAAGSNEKLNMNQDVLALGISNLVSAVSGGMPASGSLTRSTLNSESGAATRFSSLFAGIYTLIFVLLLGLAQANGIELLRYVPKSALAALVIVISLSLFNIRHIKICLHSTPGDAAVLIITLIASLLTPLHVAIFIGVALSIMLFLRKASRPQLVEYDFNDAGELAARQLRAQRSIPAISIVHCEGDLFFGAADLFRTQIQRTTSDPAIQAVILRLKNARHLDATSVMALEDLIHSMRKRGLHLLVSGASREVYRVFKLSGLLNLLQEGCNRRLGESNFFMASTHNPNLSTKNALLRAQQLLGTRTADIRIFFDPNKKKSLN